MQKNIIILFVVTFISFQSIHSMEFLKNKLGLNSAAHSYDAEKGNHSCARFAKMLAYMQRKQPVSATVKEQHSQLKELLENAVETCNARGRTEPEKAKSQPAELREILARADIMLVASQEAMEGAFKGLKLLMKVEADIIKDLSAAQKAHSENASHNSQHTK